MKNPLALFVIAISLGGCASDSQLRAQIAGANIEYTKQKLAIAAKPILDLKLPMPDCTVPADLASDAPNPCLLSIVVHAPQGGSDTQITMPEDPAWRVADRAVGVLGTGLGLYLGGAAAVGLVQATAGGIVKALQTAPDPVIVQPATPIIVEQPSPVIVTQPEPIIVPAAEPVIVEPVIVNPVIVQPQP